MQNRFPGKCGKCLKHVEANAGIVKKQGGKWVTYHGSCEEIVSQAREVDPEEYKSSVFMNKMRERFEVLMVDPDPVKASLAKDLYREFFGALIPEDEVPF